ncbi:MAG: hypothetical protein AAB504_00915 [Patescibacteria group bacterium]|mgnify:CR=1 FL=1
MKNKTKIKTFFYMIQNQEKREKELNDFLSQNGIVVEQILQSAATGSVKIKNPQYLDAGVIITIVYHETL